MNRPRQDFIIFGRRAVLEAIAEPQVQVHWVAVAGNTPGDFRRQLHQACQSGGIEHKSVDEQTIRNLGGDPRHHQGVVAEIKLLGISSIEQFLNQLTGSAARIRSAILAFDGVTNPQNLGMMVRSALAAGMTGILWPTIGSPWINGLVIKASAGTIYRCPVAHCESLVEGLWACQRAGFALCGLSSQAGTTLNSFAPPHRAVYIVGSETMGLSAEVQSLLGHTLRIDMRNHVESLNVAVAAALLCFQVAPDSLA